MHGSLSRKYGVEYFSQVEDVHDTEILSRLDDMKGEWNEMWLAKPPK